MIYDYETRMALTLCARVNEAFYDCAMDVLWKEMTDVVPLFKVLPTLQVEATADDSYSVATEHYVSVMSHSSFW